MNVCLGVGILVEIDWEINNRARELKNRVLIGVNRSKVARIGPREWKLVWTGFEPSSQPNWKPEPGLTRIRPAWPANWSRFSLRTVYFPLQNCKARSFRIGQNGPTYKYPPLSQFQYFLPLSSLSSPFLFLHWWTRAPWVRSKLPLHLQNPNHPEIHPILPYLQPGALIEERRRRGAEVEGLVAATSGSCMQELEKAQKVDWKACMYP